MAKVYKETSRKRVLFLTNIFSPYRITFLNCLAENNGIELQVCYVAEQEANRQWNTYQNEIQYQSIILPGIHLPMKNRTIHINWHIHQIMKDFQPHAVVIGTDILSSPVSWCAATAARKCGSKVIRFEGQHLFTTASSYIKNIAYKLFYRRCDAFFVYSILTKEYLHNLGIESNKITIGYNVGDTKYFMSAVCEFENSSKYLLEREKYPDVMFLFCGMLSQRKNIMALLDALHALALRDAGIFILGDGALKKQVVNFAKAHQDMNIFYEGFRQKDEIVKYFALADIFVLPTFRDPASIVLSEALVSGLYTIASVYDGSSRNFIKNGINGTIVDPKMPKQLQDALLCTYQLKKSGRINKQKIRETMTGYSVEQYAQRLAHLVRIL